MENQSLKALLPSEMTPPLKPLLVTDLEGLSFCVSFLERTPVFGYDLETNVTDNFTDRFIRTIQVGDRNEQYVIDLLAFAGSKDALIGAQGPNPTNDSLRPVVEALRPFLESKQWTKVGHNLQFEYETVRHCLGLRTIGFYDTFRVEQQLWAGLVHFMSTGHWALEDVVRKYTGFVMQDTETGKTFDLETPLTETQITYCALDARLPVSVRGGQLLKLEQAGLMDSVAIDFAAIPAFGDMHLNGVQTDDARWEDLIRDNLNKKSAILKALDVIFIPVVGTKYITAYEQDSLDELEKLWAGTSQKTPEDRALRAERRKAFMVYRSGLNERRKIADKCAGEAALPYGSPQKLLAAFRELGFGEKKLPSTGDEILEGLAKFPNLEVEDAFIGGELQAGLPVIDLLRLFRSVDKELSTYGYAWITTWDETVGKGTGHRNPVTHRIHSNIDMFGTATGRTSSSSPNIQNIPKSKRYRHCFKARPGYKIITIDFNGCELRILAEMSKEPVWLDAFSKGWDVHSVGAEILYGKEWADGAEEGCAYVSRHDKCKCKVHKKLRGAVKSINFGLCIAEGQPVLTDGGLVPIEDVTTHMRVWDGVEFVEHEGVICKGRKEVITYDGLTATPEHSVWLQDGRKVQIREAASAAARPRLAVTEVEGTPITFLNDYQRGRTQSTPVGQGRLRSLLGLRNNQGSLGAEPLIGGYEKVPLLEEVQGQAGSGYWGTLRRYATTLYQPFLAKLVKLRRSWYTKPVRVERALHQLHFGEPTAPGLQGGGYRKEEQRRALRAGECRTGDAGGKLGQSTPNGTAVVYDILNAGPRRRFTVAGKLVSNCYGMGPGKLAKSLGITFEQAQELLEKYNHSFPTVIKFLSDLGAKAKTHLEARTIIGTRRRWPKPSWDKAKERALEDAKDKTKPVTDRDVRWKYTGLWGSIEREGKNAPIQGTNANLSKLAMALVWEQLEPLFGAFFYNFVHDELVIECPEENAEACRDFVGACMTQAGAMWIKLLPMTWEAEIEDTWTKG